MRKVFQDSMSIYSSIIALIGFVLQLVPTIPNNVKYVLLTLFVIVFVFLPIRAMLKRRNIKRKSLINYGRKYIYSTAEKIVLFGGDLSWIDDYYEDISHILKNHKTVEVFYPSSKLENLNDDKRLDFQKQITKLKEIGVCVYQCSTDYGLRCMLRDPDSYENQDLYSLLLARRVVSIDKVSSNNKYRVSIYSYNEENEREICKSFLANYRLIKKEHSVKNSKNIDNNIFLKL